MYRPIPLEQATAKSISAIERGCTRAVQPRTGCPSQPLSQYFIVSWRGLVLASQAKIRYFSDF